MADETTITQITESAPGVETAKLNLIADVEQFIKDQVEAGTLPPGFTVADLTDQQLEAVKLAEEGVGSYEPFITAGSEAIGAGTGAITGAGMGAYEKASEFVDPSAIAQFFNPYEQQVVDQTLADLNRASQMEGVAGRARAAGAGAFGGSRMAVEEAERSGRLFDASARSAGQLRQQGYTQAAQLAQNAAALQSQIGAGIGSLGATLGNLGTQQAGLGELTTKLNQADINNMMTVGGMLQNQQQNELEAQRLTDQQNYYLPYQQYGFVSDIISQTPSAMQTTSASASPSVPWWQTAANLGIGTTAAGVSASKAGIL